MNWLRLDLRFQRNADLSDRSPSIGLLGLRQAKMVGTSRVTVPVPDDQMLEVYRATDFALVAAKLGRLFK